MMRCVKESNHPVDDGDYDKNGYNSDDDDDDDYQVTIMIVKLVTD